MVIESAESPTAANARVFGRGLPDNFNEPRNAAETESEETSMQIKFDTLKDRALAELYSDIRVQFEGLRWKGESGLAAVRFAKMTVAERAELRAFADAFPAPKDPDPLVTAAKDHSPIAMSLLREREGKAILINRCDARQAGALIREFPAIVPKKYRAAPFTAYMADDPDATWMIGFDAAPAAA